MSRLRCLDLPASLQHTLSIRKLLNSQKNSIRLANVAYQFIAHAESSWQSSVTFAYEILLWLCAQFSHSKRLRKIL